jgi:hypothetical protein
LDEREMSESMGILKSIPGANRVSRMEKETLDGRIRGEF